MNAFITTPSISRERAPDGIEHTTARWQTWHCDSNTFQHRYVPGATFYVVKGRARLTFAHGAQLDIEAGDFVSIGDGAEAVWEISAPVETRYAYHDDRRPATEARS
ncbi:cupin domain-containing protein [Paraburkholderia azotifigens]|uniref:Cupin domain-containing protein n=1 Tax=Paraburkholderia azotifigens TaxID=2057004 RepID=A0A5C6V2K8_9BURK|nr:cupin domain-containing protein [Paraburkholderia azotifigens]TXC79224.1 cupin domain-containing protein [Paraburkholderia azotifigens]